MKIGINLVGVSNSLGRNFAHCANNLHEFLIDPFKKDHDISLYTSTYIDHTNSELLNIYNPKKHQFLDINGSHQVLTYKKSLEQLLDQNNDFIISTRFDIHFHQKINEIGINYSKFNALFKEKGWWNNMKFTTDNFFAFPHTMLNSFILVLDDLYQNPSRQGQTDLHQAFFRVQNIVGEQQTNIISNIDELSNTNLYYSLCNHKWGVR